jgi:hypothetical protein
LERGQKVSLVIRAADKEYRLESEVIRVRNSAGRNDIALRFLHGQRGTIGALALVVLNGGAMKQTRPRTVESRPGGPRPVAA